jgi:hypothetical protein
MTKLQRPGVVINEVLAAAQADTGVSLSNACFVGAHPRGRVAQLSSRRSSSS